MSREVSQRCGICRCYMDRDDLFCANCGTENPAADQSQQPLQARPSHYSFDCHACGASMSYDASAQALRCPFCGSTKMERRATARSISPQGVVPFQVQRQPAETALRNWLGKGFWRPGDAARAATIGEMTAVYVPYWVFAAQTDTKWTADASPAPPGSRGDWYPVSGSQRGNYRGVLVAGSSILTSTETQAIAPFDIQAAVGPEQVDLENSIAEEFRVPRKLARPQARAAVEQLEREACARKLSGRHRNMRVNVRISAMHGAPLLLPVWILAYRYRDNVHRVLINGQTGNVAGTAPFSYAKLWGIILAVLLLLAVLAVGAVLSNL